jgi:hypothetical protein
MSVRSYSTHRLIGICFDIFAKYSVSYYFVFDIFCSLQEYSYMNFFPKLPK